MPLFDSSGKEVEGALTPEEITAKISEKDTTIADLQKKIDDAVSKGTSVVEMRKQLDAKTKEMEDFKTKVIQDLSKRDDEQREKEIDGTVIRIAEGDKILADAIKKDYLDMVKDGDSEDVKRDKMGKAYRLNSQNASPDIVQNIVGGAGAPSSGSGDPQVGGFPESLIQLALHLGLTRDDFKNRKYKK